MQISAHQQQSTDQINWRTSLQLCISLRNCLISRALTVKASVASGLWTWTVQQQLLAYHKSLISVNLRIITKLIYRNCTLLLVQNFGHPSPPLGLRTPLELNIIKGNESLIRILLIFFTDRFNTLPLPAPYYLPHAHEPYRTYA